MKDSSGGTKRRFVGVLIHFQISNGLGNIDVDFTRVPALDLWYLIGKAVLDMIEPVVPRTDLGEGRQEIALPEIDTFEACATYVDGLAVVELVPKKDHHVE